MTTKGLLPSTSDFLFYVDDISSQNVEFVSGFGFLPTLTTATNGNDIWPGTALTLPTPAQPGGEQMDVVSSNANDTAAGTGVQKVDVYYIDHNGDQKIETVTMNGVTPVPTVATDLRFIQLMHTSQVGTNGAAVGTIAISKHLAAATQYTLIQPGRNHSSNTARMVPAGKVCVIRSFNCSGSNSHFGEIHLRSTSDFGGPLPGIFLSMDTALVFNSTSAHIFDPPLLVPALAIIKCTGFTTDANGNFTASWYGIFVNTPT